MNITEQLVDINQLARTKTHRGIVPLSKSGIYAKVKSGEFPAPFHLSPRKSVWDIRDIESWVEKQKRGGAA